MPGPSISPSSLSSTAPIISNIGVTSRAIVLSPSSGPSIRVLTQPETRNRGLPNFWVQALLGKKPEESNPKAKLTPAIGSSSLVEDRALRSFLHREIAGETIQKIADSPYYRGLLPSSPPQSSFEDGESSAFPKSSVKPSSFFASKLQGFGTSFFRFGARKESEITGMDQDFGGKETLPAGLIERAAKDIAPARNMTSESPSLTGAKRHADGSPKKPLSESFPNNDSGPADLTHIDDHDQAVPEHPKLQHEPIVTVLSSEEGVWKNVFFGGVGDGNPTSEDEKVRKFEWADKYRPETLEEFICNRSKADQLQLMARNKDGGHFIFQGPPGVGKRTMMFAMLREDFSSNSVDQSEVRSIEVLVKESQVVEVNLSEYQGCEKDVIFEHIRERSSTTLTESKPTENCRAIIFYGVDTLSEDAILYIKWLLERYKVCDRIFFCCNDIAQLQAITPLCTVVQLLPPSRLEIMSVLKHIAGKEGIELPVELAEKITDSSKCNFRQAIRSFEATWRKRYPFKEDHQEVLTGWEDDIANIAKKMILEQSPRQLYVIRGKLKDLGEHDVSPEFIFKSLVDELKKHLDDLFKHRVQNLYIEYSVREIIIFAKKDESLLENDKSIMMPEARKHGIQQFLRIEEFIAKFMSCYKAESTRSSQHDSQHHYVVASEA